MILRTGVDPKNTFIFWMNTCEVWIQLCIQSILDHMNLDQMFLDDMK